MSSPVVGYWVADNLGRVLGPLALQALRELIASGRLKAAVRASRDGTHWVTLPELPELSDLLASARPSPSVELQQAERLRAQMRAMQNLPVHEVFGLKPTSNLDELRLAYFRMAKRFTPDHIAPETHPELKKVSAEIFDFLSRRMREAEASWAQATQPPRPPPPVMHAVPHAQPPAPPRPPPVVQASPAAAARAPVMAAAPAPVMTAAPAPRPVQAAPVMARAPIAPTPAPPPPAPSVRRAAAAPTYSSAEFVGLERRSDDRIHADVKVTLQNAGIFTDHRIINLSSGGLFIATDKPLRLGTQVELTLRFDDPLRVITLRSAVIWENSLEDGKNPRGYGLRLSHLRPEEKEFVQKYLARAKEKKK